MVRLFVLIMLTFIVNVAAAEIYKWVDKNGNVHFGDKPNRKGAVEMDVGNASNNNPNSYSDEAELTRDEKRKKILDALNEDREDRNRLTQEKRQQQKIKKIRCAELKDKLRRVKRAAGLYNLDENGERVFISKKDKNKSENNLKKAIDKNCR